MPFSHGTRSQPVMGGCLADDSGLALPGFARTDAVFASAATPVARCRYVRKRRRVTKNNCVTVLLDRKLY